MVNKIINCNVYDVTDIELEFSSSEEISSIQHRNENLKNKQAYKELVHDDTIIWYSDNTYDEAANILKIEKELEQIKLTFIDNPDDPSFGFGIRICNSSSKYDPFNICFMDLFNHLQLIAKETPIKRLVKTMKK